MPLGLSDRNSGVSKLTKCLLKNLGQIQCANLPQCYSWNKGFFNTLSWRQSCPAAYTFFSRQAITPILQKVLRTKRRDDIRPQTSKHYWSVGSRSIVPLLWKSEEKGLAWNHGRRGYLNLFLSYRSNLGNLPTAHHYMTWHLGIGDEHFLARLMPFLMFSEIFSISATSYIRHGIIRAFSRSRMQRYRLFPFSVCLVTLTAGASCCGFWGMHTQSFEFLSLIKDFVKAD